MKFSLCRLIALMFLFANFTFAQETEREKGIEFYNKGEYKQAVETLQKVVQADEKDRQAWLYLGMSQTKSLNKSAAVKAFQKADKIAAQEKESGETQTKLKITSQPRPNYTDSARMNQTQGTIKLAVEFSADGEIKTIVAFQTLPDGLTENCIEAVKKIKFEPATKNGKAYSTIGILTYSFTIF